jgi:hypothetical protein
MHIRDSNSTIGGALRRRRPALARWCRAAAAPCLGLFVSGCVNLVAQNAPGALQTAENRAKFELNCPNVQASILSQKIVEGLRMAGSEHTIGVRGCGKEAVYITYCRDASDCNAFSQTGRVNAVPDTMP